MLFRVTPEIIFFSGCLLLFPELESKAQGSDAFRHLKALTGNAQHVTDKRRIPLPEADPHRVCPARSQGRLHRVLLWAGVSEGDQHPATAGLVLGAAGHPVPVRGCSDHCLQYQACNRSGLNRRHPD